MNNQVKIKNLEILVQMYATIVAIVLYNEDLISIISTALIIVLSIVASILYSYLK